MVKGFWYNRILWNIKKTDYRIKHMEKHGRGAVAMKEKDILAKVKKLKKDMEDSA